MLKACRLNDPFTIFRLKSGKQILFKLIFNSADMYLEGVFADTLAHICEPPLMGGRWAAALNFSKTI